MKWLSDNYKWLFDGIGAVAAIGILGFLFKRFWNSQQQVAKETLKVEDSSLAYSPIVSGSHNQIYINHAEAPNRIEQRELSNTAMPVARVVITLTKSELLQYLILKFAIAINTDGHGRPATCGSLSNAIRETVPNLNDTELHDTLLYLYGRRQLILHKFQGAIPYQTLTEYYQFPIKNGFFNGQFRLLVTPQGRVCFYELEARVS